MLLKKLITFGLVLSFFLSNSVGLILLYNQIKIYHKKSIKESIENNSYQEVVEILSFSKNRLLKGDYNLKFIESHEFRFNGKMYDIILKWENEDSIFYKCINDTREEDLELTFVKFILSNTERQDLPLPIKQILKSLNFEFVFYPQDFNYFYSQIERLKVNHTIFFIENISEIPDPPPRIFS